MIETKYLQKMLGDKFKVVQNDCNNPEWCEIITQYQMPNNDLISIYFNPSRNVISDDNGADFEMGLFNDDWDKLDYVMAMLKANSIAIGEDKELSKFVTGDFAKEFDNFAKVIAHIVAYVTNDMIKALEDKKCH